MSKTISTEEFDKLVDEGKEDVLQYFDLKNARRGDPGTKRINIDLPNEFLAELDREATRRGITRQSLIKVWLYEKLHGESLTVQLMSALNRRKAGISIVETSTGSQRTTAAVAEAPKSTEEGSGMLRSAVVAILENTKKPLRTAEIYDALVEQGYQFTFKDAKKGLGIRLYKMLGVQPLGGGLFKPK